MKLFSVLTVPSVQPKPRSNVCIGIGPETFFPKNFKSLKLNIYKLCVSVTVSAESIGQFMIIHRNSNLEWFLGNT